MKTPRERIIEKGLEIVGEDTKAVSKKPYLTEGGTLTNMYRDDYFTKGYNQALENIRSRIPQLADEVIGIVVGEIEKILIIDVNPSSDDQRTWYRGLGREEAQREMREKVITSLTQDNIKGDNE
jgi:hypothetical protein